MDNTILMVEIVDYHDDPPTIAARFWWSEHLGVTSDEPTTLYMLSRKGIQIWQDGKPVVLFPRDGRAFLDALPRYFSGLWSAREPVAVESQGGSSEK